MYNTMGQKSILVTIGVIIFAVLFVVLLILSRLEPSKSTKNQKTQIVEPKKTINAVDVVEDPLVYDGYNIEVESQITDWVTDKSFTLLAGENAGVFGGTPKQLLIITKSPFSLPKDTNEKEVGLGETVSVLVKGKARIMSKAELSRELGIDLDGTDIKLDDNDFDKWIEGSVILAETVEKL